MGPSRNLWAEAVLSSFHTSFSCISLTMPLVLPAVLWPWQHNTQSTNPLHNRDDLLVISWNGWYLENKTRENVSAEVPDWDGNALYKATGTDVSVSNSWTQLVFNIINWSFLKQVLQLEHDVLILRRICIFLSLCASHSRQMGVQQAKVTGKLPPVDTNTHSSAQVSQSKWVFPLLTEVSTQRFSSHHALPLEPITPLTWLHLFDASAPYVRGSRAGTVRMAAGCVLVLFVLGLNEITVAVWVSALCMCARKWELECIGVKLMSGDKWWLHHLEI